MKKAVLISIRPKWCDLIIRGKKTLEIRNTRPKLETPFNAYIYCTKAPPHLITIFKDGEETMGGEIHHGKPVFLKCDKYLPDSIRDKTAMVIGEFVCNRISTITPPGPFSIRNEVSGCCLTYDEVKKYAGWDNSAVSHDELRDLYGWHISDLKIYDKPRSLHEFCRFDFQSMNGTGICGNTKCENYIPSDSWMQPPECAIDWCYLKRPPQSWCYVKEL